MSIMRPVFRIVILLLLVSLFAGCEAPPYQAKETTTTPTPMVTAEETATQTAVVPTTTSPFIPVTLVPADYIPTPSAHYTVIPTTTPGNLVLIDEKILTFVYSGNAYAYTLDNPPLFIDWTLAVPNVTRTFTEKDPTKVPTEENPSPTRIINKTYPDPSAWFQVIVLDLGTRKVVAREGYGRGYDISTSKWVWIKYPGRYYIEFSGNQVTADIRFLVNKGT